MRLFDHGQNVHLKHPATQVIHRTTFFKVISLMVALFLSLACSDDGKQTQDSFSDLTQNMQDAGLDSIQQQEGGSGLDMATSDAQVAACSSSVNLDPLKLDKAYCGIARFELPTDEHIAAFTFAGSSFWVLADDGKSDTFYQFKNGSIKEGTINFETGISSALTTYFSFSVSGADEQAGWASYFLAMSPNKAKAAVGYTTSNNTDDHILWGSKDSQTPSDIAQATGNYDAVFIDDQTLLISAQGVGATQENYGIYLYQEGETPKRLIALDGKCSGHLALGAQTLYASGCFGAEYPYTGKLYGFSLNEVKAAISNTKTLSLDQDGDLVYEDKGGTTFTDVATVNDELLLLKKDTTDWLTVAIEKLTITVNADTITPGETKQIVTLDENNKDVAVYNIASDKNQIALFMENAAKKSELVFIMPK